MTIGSFIERNESAIYRMIPKVTTVKQAYKVMVDYVRENRNYPDLISTFQKKGWIYLE